MWKLKGPNPQTLNALLLAMALFPLGAGKRKDFLAIPIFHLELKEGSSLQRQRRRQNFGAKGADF